MEDPWGSPWAEQSDKPAQSTKSLLLSPPPRAFFGGPSSSSSISPTTQLPWSEKNDTLDDWPVRDRAPSRSSQSGWSPWADSPSKTDSTFKQETTSTTLTPLRKPSSIAASPGLQALPRSRSSSVFRHHSPDPWADGISRTAPESTAPVTPPNTQLEPQVSSRISSLDTSRVLHRPDSPITPNDESKIRQGPIAAEGLTGQVAAYDGLTHVDLEEPLSPQDRSGGWDKGSEEEDQEKLHVVDGSRNTQDPDRTDNTETEKSDQVSPKKHERIDLLAKITREYGPIQFQPDIRALDGLFAKELSEIGGNPETANMTDHIITDSFTEFSQRKVWHRISRYGSKRMHDSGQEQSYHRLLWNSSTVHRDTMVIVRRWMQEDSITGTATLGGMKGSVFNWDSPAAPVDLDLVFKRNSSLRHSKNSSQSSHTAEPTEKAPSPLSRKDETPSSPIAFGWSSTKETTLPRKYTNSIPPPPTIATTQSIDLQPLTGSSTVSETQPKKAPRLAQASGDGADDDDWGEMVTS